jgi:glycine cleavage system regulatory protein
MQTSLIVTVIAPDRPGLVSAVSEKAREFGANWADSLMANLAGQFAGILHLQVPTRNADMLIAALQALDGANMRITIARGSSLSVVKKGLRRVRLDLVGQDRAGIVQTISKQLADRGVSIEKLETRIESGAMSGEQLFHMHAQVSVPATLDDHMLREGLESIANELMVDIDLDRTHAFF